MEATNTTSDFTQRFKYHNILERSADLPERPIDVLVYFVIPARPSRILNFVGAYYRGGWYKDGQKVDKEFEVVGWRNIP